MWTRLNWILIWIVLAIATYTPRIALGEPQEEPDSFDLLGYFPTKESLSRVSPYQLRVSVLYGPVTYTSTDTATDATVTAQEFQAGVRAEMDRWFQVGRSNRRTLGISADFQALSVSSVTNLMGPPIRYFSGSFLLGLRLWGFGHSQPWTPEGSLLFGAALEAFPTMQVSFNLTHYTVAVPLALGTRAGLRMRFPIFPDFQMLSLETAFFGTVPLRLIDNSAGDIVKSQTHSLGGNALLDLKLGGKIVLGVGAYVGWFSLEYTPTGAVASNRISFLTTSLLSSLRMTF